MNDNKLKTTFFIIAVGFLYFSGVAAILYPMASNVLSLSTSRTAISDYVETVRAMPEEEKSQLWETAEKYNRDIADSNYSDGLERCLCDKDGLVCYVDVPDVSIYLPVYYGATDDNLVKGAALLENTSLPTGGKNTHCVISGHTGLPSAEMFTKLDQLTEGQVFYIHVLDRVLAYRAELISVVTPDKVELLRIAEDEDLCTLLTCTPYGINDKRLLVRGTRIPYEPETKKKPEAVPSGNDDAEANEALAAETQGQLTIIILIAGVSVLIYAAGVIWLMITIRRLRYAEHLRK